MEKIHNKLLLKIFIIGIFLSICTFSSKVYALQDNSFNYSGPNGWWGASTGYSTNDIGSRVVSGDYNNDGRSDVALLYDYGNGETRIHVFLSNGSTFEYQSPNGWWKSEGYNAKDIKNVVSGDFNGDGYDDIAVLYNYGSGHACIHVFKSTGSSFDYGYSDGWWKSDGYYPENVCDLVCGDFNGDGYDDIAAMYNYGSGHARIHVFKSTGSSFNYEYSDGWWKSDGYYPENICDLVCGDFNGDGYDDVAAMYNYGSGRARIHVFKSTGSSFNYEYSDGWWKSDGYYPENVKDRVVAGDFNNDGKDDIGAIYDYGTNGEARIHVFLSTGYSFEYQSPEGWWKSNGYYPQNVTGRVVAGNFNGTGGTDIATVYSYGTSATKIHVFNSNNSVNSDAIRLVDIAKRELGKGEDGNGVTEYGKWYGYPSGDWCAMFVSWCANKAGISTSIIPKHSACVSGANTFKSWGCWASRDSGYVPKSGDIIYFNYDGGINHVGIVERVENGIVYTIEGNTKYDNVASCSYPLNYYSIAGYGIPKY